MLRIRHNLKYSWQVYMNNNHLELPLTRVGWLAQMFDAGWIKFWMLTNVVGTEEVACLERVVAQMAVVMFVTCAIVRSMWPHFWAFAAEHLKILHNKKGLVVSGEVVVVAQIIVLQVSVLGAQNAPFGNILFIRYNCVVIEITNWWMWHLLWIQWHPTSIINA